MKFKNIKKISLLLTLTLAGCQSIDYDPQNVDANDPVVFGGALNEIRNSGTRARTLITDATYNVTFNNESGYETGSVSFNSNGIGYSKRWDYGSLIDLLWGYVAPLTGSADTYSFYLDNIPEPYNQNSPLVELGPDNLYKVAEYLPEEKANPEEGIYSNDLYWGAKENVLRQAVEDVDIYPVMSRFCLKLYIDNSAVGEEFYPESASLTNIFQTPKTFDRLTGTFGFQSGEEDSVLPDEEPFTLVEDNAGWKLIHDEESGLDYYLSPDFIIAPQEFLRDQRPRLSVKLTNGLVYSGLFPLAMYLLDENGGMSSWIMSFLKGYKLTMSVKIGNEAGNLLFMPSTLIDWWDKGTKNFTGYQASVAKDEDLNELIEAYNSGREDQFYKWGYKDQVSGKWIFNIFKSFEFEASLFSARMEESSAIPYDFDLHYTFIKVIRPDGKEATLSDTAGAKALKDLLDKGIIPDADPEII